MRKAIIITILFLSIVYIGTHFYAPINQVALILKHVSLFLILGIFAYFIVTLISKKIVKKYSLSGKGVAIINITRVISFTLVIILVSVIQYDFVSYSETPSMKYCSYYDKYNNLIYETVFHSICPEINIIQNENNILQFSITEESDAPEVAYLADEDIRVGHKDQFHIQTLSHIKITYNDNQRIDTIDQQYSYIAKFENDSEFTNKYYSYHKIIHYDYSNVFESTVKTAEMENIFTGINEFNLTHHVFSDENYKETIYHLEELNRETSISGNESINYNFIKEENETDVSLGTITRYEENKFLDYEISYSDSNIEQGSSKHGDSPDIDFLYENTFKNTFANSRIYSNVYYEQEMPFFIKSSTYITQTIDTDTSDRTDIVFDKFEQDGKTYLTPMEKRMINTNYLPYFYEIEETDFGYIVAHQYYNTSPYFWHIFALGTSDVEDKMYLEDGRFYYGLRYQILFDIEYEITQFNNESGIYKAISFFDN